MASQGPGLNLPRRGNALTSFLGRQFLILTGWRIVGNFPDVPKFVIIVAPHTSNWDLVFGTAAAFALDVRVHWMGKHTLFNGCQGKILKKLGGIPVNREEPQGTIEEIVALFRQEKRLGLCITPEGTRKRVGRWKTGFYRISMKARVPIILGFLDYRTRTVGIGPLVEPSGDFNADFKKILDFFRNKKAKYPERFNPDPAMNGMDPG